MKLRPPARTVVRARQWTTCIRITELSDVAPALDPSFLEAKGVHPRALTVLRLLRDHVSPIVKAFRPQLEGFHFLIHDAQSGVPTTSDDRDAYIHMRLFFKKPIPFALHAPFVFTTPGTNLEETNIGGINLDIVRGDSAVEKCQRIMKLLNDQSVLVLQMVDAHVWDTGNEALMLQQTRQVFHWIANMLQMRLA